MDNLQKFKCVIYRHESIPIDKKDLDTFSFQICLLHATFYCSIQWTKASHNQGNNTKMQNLGISIV